MPAREEDQWWDEAYETLEEQASSTLKRVQGNIESLLNLPNQLNMDEWSRKILAESLENIDKSRRQRIADAFDRKNEISSLIEQLPPAGLRAYIVMNSELDEHIDVQVEPWKPNPEYNVAHITPVADSNSDYGAVEVNLIYHAKTGELPKRDTIMRMIAQSENWQDLAYVQINAIEVRVDAWERVVSRDGMRVKDVLAGTEEFADLSRRNMLDPGSLSSYVGQESLIFFKPLSEDEPVERVPNDVWESQASYSLRSIQEEHAFMSVMSSVAKLRKQ